MEVKFTVNEGSDFRDFDRWPLNRGDRLMAVKFTVNKGSDFQDFDRWPLNRVTAYTGLDYTFCLHSTLTSSPVKYLYVK